MVVVLPELEQHRVHNLMFKYVQHFFLAMGKFANLSVAHDVCYGTRVLVVEQHRSALGQEGFRTQLLLALILDTDLPKTS